MDIAKGMAVKKNAKYSDCIHNMVMQIEQIPIQNPIIGSMSVGGCGMLSWWRYLRLILRLKLEIKEHLFVEFNIT